MFPLESKLIISLFSHLHLTNKDVKKSHKEFINFTIIETMLTNNENLIFKSDMTLKDWKI